MTQSGPLSSLSALSGGYHLHPGRARSIVGARPVVHANTLGRVLRGQSGPGLVRTLGSLFSLCAHAHQRVAALAFNAACPGAEPLPVAPLMQHRLNTVHDHLRSMALDWPARLLLAPHQAQRLLALANTPVMQGAGDQMSNTQVVKVLAQLQHDLNATDKQHHPNTLSALADWADLAERLQVPLRPLDVLSLDAPTQNAALRALAQAMADPDFVQAPRWQDQCAETGAWTRLRHQTTPAAANLSAWSRLTSRWHEVLTLATATPLADDARHDTLLSSGALALDDACAMAWCEMARGLLLHWVKVDAQGRVADYRVLAPTEWNFHAQGALAKSLSALAPDDVTAARCLAAAFDACVVCDITHLNPESPDA